MTNLISIYIFILLGSINLNAQEISFDDIDPLASIKGQPSFSAVIPDELCKSKFLYQKRVQRKLHLEGNAIEFSVFTYTTRLFDKSKESMLIVDGGPGGISTLKFAEIISDSMYSNYNVIFFHNRGGGCSQLPSTDTKFDKFINSQSVVADMEAIRQVYDIKSWKAVIGYSYGTNTARSYANEFPSKVQTLVLEGLDKIISNKDTEVKSETVKSADLDLEHKTATIIEIMKTRYVESVYLNKYISEEKYNHFLKSTFTEYLKNFGVGINYYLLGYWASYTNFFNQFYKNNIPSYLNQHTFAAVFLLNYTGTTDTADYYILYILNQFLGIELDVEFTKDVEMQLTATRYKYYPFLNPSYMDSGFESGRLFSQRVFLAMSKNDQNFSEKSLCSTVKTIIINGTLDNATPVENVDLYLKNKSCASHVDNTALIVKNGGHTNSFEMKCLSVFINDSLTGKTNESVLDSCEKPVSIRKY